MSESIGARITRESFEKHQREIAEDARDNATVALSAIDKANDLEQRLARIAEILATKLAYALSDYESPHSVMVGPFTDSQAREVQQLLEGT